VSYGLTLRKDAEKDIKSAFSYYQSCRQGLGEEFLLCVEITLEKTQRNPSLFRSIYRRVRRSMMHRFPYSVYFIVESQQIIVVARDSRASQSGSLADSRLIWN
jgi:hypothetical protein